MPLPIPSHATPTSSCGSGDGMPAPTADLQLKRADPKALCACFCCRGKDIGSQLLRHVVGGSSAAIYLTTLRKTIPFYEAAGFRLLQASEVPW